MKNYLVLITLICSTFFTTLLKAQQHGRAAEIAVAGKYNLHLKPLLRNEHIEWEVLHNFPNVTQFQVALSTNTDTLSFSNTHPTKLFPLPKFFRIFCRFAVPGSFTS